MPEQAAHPPGERGKVAQVRALGHPVQLLGEEARRGQERLHRLPLGGERRDQVLPEGVVAAGHEELAAGALDAEHPLGIELPERHVHAERAEQALHRDVAGVVQADVELEAVAGERGHVAADLVAGVDDEDPQAGRRQVRRGRQATGSCPHHDDVVIVPFVHGDLQAPGAQ